MIVNHVETSSVETKSELYQCRNAKNVRVFFSKNINCILPKIVCHSPNFNFTTILAASRLKGAGDFFIPSTRIFLTIVLFRCCLIG